MQAQQRRTFRSSLLRWFRAQKRDLPWRRTRDPYAVWISEIMLQQTRVAAVIPYYERFLARFPDLHTLAAAPEAELLAHWAGLGYYHRARNLQKAARSMAGNGGFPATYEGIRQLAGVGDYTAAAVASIALSLPHAVVDGNVFRVLSRVFSDSTDIAKPSARAHFGALAGLLLDRKQPGEFNQALMELGATVCLPRSPQCLLCPVSGLCQARRDGTVAQFPVKGKRKQQVVEHRTVFWIAAGSRLLLWQRPPGASLMPGFWELPELHHLPAAQPGRKLGSFRHGITFHDYRFDLLEAPVPDDVGICAWVPLEHLDTLPLSTVVRKALKHISE